jgi:hypothetical protein
MMVLDVPTLSHLDSLASSDTFRAYLSDPQHIKLVLHMGPTQVLRSQLYGELMAFLGNELQVRLFF